MDPLPIPPSRSDLERRRLESTIDNDLYSLSLSSLPTSTTSQSHSHSFISTSSSSNLSLEYPRADSVSMSSQPHHGHAHGPTGTPRAAAGRKLSSTAHAGSRMSSLAYGGANEQSMFVGASPVSTAGHHASAVTLGAGVFRSKGDEYGDNTGGEFDPERSLGRLVGELGRVMGSDRLPSRPTSPFSPPRSPSPLPSLQNSQPANLSFTLTRNDPLLSPPSSNEDTLKGRPETQINTRFSSLARELGDDIRATHQGRSAPVPRRALSDSTIHNIVQTPAPSKKRVTKDRGDRLKALQDENRRSASAPVRGQKDMSGDVTGFTALMATPAKGEEFGTLGKNADVGGEAGANIPQTLATLHARLRALETENTVSRRRVRELEEELEKARAEVDSAKQSGGSRLREVVGEKSALEDLVKSLRAHLARLTVEVEQNKAVISELRQVASRPAKVTPPPHSPSVSTELASLRREIERLSREVEKLGGIVEEGLETRKKARGERTMRMEQEEMERLVRQVVDEETEELRRARRDMERREILEKEADRPAEPTRLRQGLHTAASDVPTLAPPSVQPSRSKTKPVSQHPTAPPSDGDDGLYDSPTPPSRSSSRLDSLDARETTQHKTKSSRRESHHRISKEGPHSPFPSIVGDELEKEFFSPLRQNKSPWAHNFTRREAVEVRSTGSGSGSRVPSGRGSPDGQALPPQTVLARVVAELEDDFDHYKVIYAELADQYKVLDPASVSAKRHVLADHLREVIDTLEKKADQIGDLYDLLAFNDKPLSASGQATSSGKGGWVGKSVGDVMRMVKESLGEEGWERLERDLKGRSGTV
ncbi:hypothetical protein IAR55_001071 [Kwoniella newhampshirensis]|uniref:Cep57 centrosome microtubule-binding domain-containing protein n=1 Tax=Kwoniella newhampshirensis TaxID=1651941 RepID=A0AAW0Z4Z4_9TREE